MFGLSYVLAYTDHPFRTQMMGANPPGLKALIEKHAGPAVAAEPATVSLERETRNVSHKLTRHLMY